MKAWWVALAVFVQACAPARAVPPAAGPSTVSGRNPASIVDELRNATYLGIDSRIGTLTLVNGQWTASGPTPGAPRAVVRLDESLQIAGDMDGDGREEFLAPLTYSTGGSGVFTFLAVMAQMDGRLSNIGTAALGDRSQLRSARIENGRLIVDLVRTGAADAACCPGELATLTWALNGRQLVALEPVVTGRLSPATLGATVWELQAWDVMESATPVPPVTLTYVEGRFTGASGCNRYFATVLARGDVPGAMSVGPVGGTRMACPEPQSAVESRYLNQLGGARSVGFLMGRLAVGYTRPDGTVGTMLFSATSRPAGP